MNVYENWQRFIDLFGGLDRINEIGAFGTGAGQWVKRPLRSQDVVKHLEGEGPGIGIPPLGSDNCVMFAAIDLDEPDFDAAREMQKFLPKPTFIERSRSGNAHVWAFFREPLEAWVAMGILKEAVEAAGKTSVEVFPKNHDFSRVKFGNYINLPYHGEERPIVREVLDGGLLPRPAGVPLPVGELQIDQFLTEAYEGRHDPEAWRKRARWLLLEDPATVRANRTVEFGKSERLHRCAEYIITNAEDNPVVEGHRNAVYFALAKMLSNCSLFDHDEAFDLMKQVNDASPDKAPISELRRILNNAERGQYTSTDCDNPLVIPYSDPECPIAHPRR